MRCELRPVERRTTWIPERREYVHWQGPAAREREPGPPTVVALVVLSCAASFGLVVGFVIGAFSR